MNLQSQEAPSDAGICPCPLPDQLIDLGSGAILNVKFFLKFVLCYAFLAIVLNFWLGVLWTTLKDRVYDIFLLSFQIKSDICCYTLGSATSLSFRKRSVHGLEKPAESMTTLTLTLERDVIDYPSQSKYLFAEVNILLLKYLAEVNFPPPTAGGSGFHQQMWLIFSIFMSFVDSNSPHFDQSTWTRLRCFWHKKFWATAIPHWFPLIHLIASHHLAVFKVSFLAALLINSSTVTLAPQVNSFSVSLWWSTMVSICFAHKLIFLNFLSLEYRNFGRCGPFWKCCDEAEALWSLLGGILL